MQETWQVRFCSGLEIRDRLAYFFMISSGLEIHDQVAYFFIDIHIVST